MRAKTAAPGRDASSGLKPGNADLIRTVYRRLLSFHGPQGWWPIVNEKLGRGEYHIGAPRSASDFFEIAIGAILTQNVSWKNVDSALLVLKKKNLLNPESLMRLAPARLAGLIVPTGYYNQKAKKIKNFIRWYAARRFDWRGLGKMDVRSLREELLSVNGVGPETADSILLYALGAKIFVVDAYTVRMFTRLGVLTGNEKYHDIQELFHRRFKGDAADYNEYHALIVAHGKDFCKKKPRCDSCCLSALCCRSGPVSGRN